MKIAMVSEHASPLAAVGGVDAGGQNVHVEALARVLARAGHEVTVHTRRDATDLPPRVTTPGGVVVDHLDAGPPEPLAKDDLLPLVGEMGAALAERFAADPPDVVHAHFWMSGLAALPASRDLGIPLVQTFHALGVTKRRFQGRLDTSPLSRVRKERALARAVDRVIATCSDEVTELRRMGVGHNRITVVPSGVDTAVFSPDGSVAERGDRPRILCVGRLVPRKGVDTLIHALVTVPDAELVVAGGRTPEALGDDPEITRLTRLATELGVVDRIRFLGAVARPDIPGLLRSADVVACTPWYEPFGIVPLEAMACGVPVVASAVGGMLDTVVDGVTGKLVPPRRPDLLGAELRRLLADPSWRGAYGAAGIDRARSRYSWDRVAADTLAVYEEVAGRLPAGELEPVVETSA